jgi:DNA polymerase-4
MERTILHSDMNGFYAAVECLYRPEIRNKPVVVVGDVEARHGIVLAKNEIAKQYKIKTGNPLWLVKQVCPECVFVPPNFERYLRFSKLAREIYADYTDKIEAFGLDECWLDVTGEDGKKTADEIRRRIEYELGVTVSVGVSWNKIFAKLGSDIKKPNATTVIDKDNYKQLVWNLPVGDLLYVGKATRQKLEKYGITTIGALAQTKLEFLEKRFGKIGIMLWVFANGLDDTPVAQDGAAPVIKSIGNSTTTPRDLVCHEDVKITLKLLSESVSARLREQGFLCRTVQIGIRDTDLCWIERQGKLDIPNRTAKSIYEKAYALFCENWQYFKPIRSLSVRACDLEVPQFEQMSLLPEAVSIQTNEKLEQAIDAIRNRFGFFSIKRGMMLTDELLSGLDAKNEHVIHPVGFLR